MSKMRRRKMTKGSCTVEAALLMTILLPLFIAVLYMGFFLHDRGFLQGAAFEAAAYASLHADDGEADAGGAAGRRITGRLLGTGNVGVQASAGERQVSISYSGNFSIPAPALPFLGGNHQIKADVTLSLERPSRRIQKIRGVTKVIQTFRRTLE